MATVYTDASCTDDERRGRLYAGDLFVYAPGEGSSALCALARRLSEDAFSPHEPELAQDHMPAAEYAAILADLKPRFIHHPEAKEAIGVLLREVGCDTTRTYFDVPRLRTMASGDYLQVGLALQFHPHRDTWFSAPYAQLNWWLPVYEVEAANSMAFHPRYFDRPVKNSSAVYDYDEWSRTGRKQAAQQISKETRQQPEPEEPLELDPDLRVVTPVGGVLIFSGAQMHSTVPNTTGRTRLSIDFRTVSIDDLVNGVSAPNVDAACKGTTLRDFVQAADLSPLPEEIIEPYDAGARITAA